MELPAQSEPAAVEGEAERTKQGKVFKLGWFEGVYMRCLLNIWGVMLFLRLTWVVGQAGLISGIGIIGLSNVVTIITSLSMSAVSTNGEIKGGGIYYMISRSLGPEFGGAIGLMFTLANSVAVSMYVIGFCESLIDMLGDYVEDFDGIISPGNRTHDIRLIGSVSLVCILALAIVGMEWVTRVQKLLLILLIGSQADFVVGTFLQPSGEQMSKGFMGYRPEVLQQNLWNDYLPDKNGRVESFFTVFSVFFPAVTGIVAGANLSGDLRDPAYSIPKGTLSAIATTGVAYVIYTIMVASCAIKYASGVLEEIDFNASNSSFALINISHSFNDCHDRDCEYGTAVNQQMMSVMSAWGPLIYAGCFAATLSSAITSLEGAPRVLQALAGDGLYPFLGTFSIGWGPNNDPVRGYILVFAISLICILIGDLNIVSSLLSNFFVAAYALINFSVFHASINQSPGWRPSFKYYNQWVSLFGTLLCLVVMFLMDYITALITFLCIISLYGFVSIRKPDVNWGSSTQAQVFMSALKSSQTLNKVPDHVKNYRPKILVMSGDPADRPNLVDFGNLITKKISLLSTIHIILDSIWDWKYLEILKCQSQQYLHDNKIKAFHLITRSSSMCDAIKSSIELHGLGRLSPNMILLGFKENWKDDAEGTEDYFKCIQTAVEMNLSVVLLRIRGGLDMSEITLEEKLNKQQWFETTSEIGRRPCSSTFTSYMNPLVHSIDSGLNLSLDYKPPLKQSSSNPTKSTDIAKEEKETFFRGKIPLEGTIDIYWLYDDSGLSLLLLHILKSRKLYSKCLIRLFFIPSSEDKIDEETEAMVKLLEKFRIKSDEVIVIKDIHSRPKEETVKKYEKSITVSRRQLADQARKEKTRSKRPWRRVHSHEESEEVKSDMSHDDLNETEEGDEYEHYRRTLPRANRQKSRKHLSQAAIRSRREKQKMLSCEQTRSRDNTDTEDEPTMTVAAETFIVPKTELMGQEESTLFHLRLAEVVQANSASSALVVMTLPGGQLDPRGGPPVSGQLFLSWLDTVTRGMPPFLLTRGDHTSKLTFYS